jgi:hypothetical protein
LAAFDPKAKYHLVSDMPGHEVEFSSFGSIQDLCTRAEEIINEARSSGLLPKIRVLVGDRCPVAGGPIPKVLVDKRWYPLMDDPGARVEDCPPDGSILGTTEKPDDEDLSHLDEEEIPTDEDDEHALTVVGSAKPSGEGEDHTIQIFNQEKG